MEFSFFNFISNSNKPIIEYIINIVGMIIIPIVVYLLSSVYAVAQNERKNKIQSLNSLTLYCKNLLQECLKLKNNEARRKNGLGLFIENPSPENFIQAFYMVRTPSLQYELYANEFAFTTTQYYPLVDLIFEINSNLKTIMAFVSEFNIQSDLARNKSREEQIKLAQEMMLQLESFHHKCNILVFMIEKLLKAVQIFNSCYFFQDIINLQFTGKMKELLNEANSEIQQMYQHSEHNWLNSFIENLENPPIQLKPKDLLYILYLKITGKYDKLIQSIKKELYKRKKEKFIAKQRTVKTACSDEKIKQLDEKYNKILNDYNICKEEFASLDVLNTKANFYMNKNLLNRLDSIIATVKNIFEILPPSRNLLLMPDEITQITINLNYLITNFIPCLNGIFKFLLLFFNPNMDVDDICFLSPELDEIIDENYKKDLKKLSKSNFYKFIENFDYANSNNIPYELASATGTEEEMYVGLQFITHQNFNNDDSESLFIYELMFLIAQKLIDISRDVYRTILENTK